MEACAVPELNLIQHFYLVAQAEVLDFFWCQVIVSDEIEGQIAWVCIYHRCKTTVSYRMILALRSLRNFDKPKLDRKFEYNP